MRYNRGFPEEIVIGENGMSVGDVERLMLSLDHDDSLGEIDNSVLMRTYKQERQKYLDEHYEMTPERRSRLQEVERMMWEKYDNMEKLCKLHVEQEKKKQQQGVRIPNHIDYHLEVDNTVAEGLSDAEIDLFDLLCAEDRYHCAVWGWKHINYSYSFNSDNYTQSDNPLGRDEREIGEDGFTNGFHSLKKMYTLAWQDMENITDFRLTVDYWYYNDCI